MKGRVYMKQVENKQIKVILTVQGETDVLVFLLDDESPEKYTINLNDSSSQLQIKEVFSKLLEELLSFDIDLVLEIQEGYSKGLYKDVFTEYISELNKELKQTRSLMKKRVGIITIIISEENIYQQAHLTVTGLRV